MCGRYYVDDETAREIEKLVRQLDERRGQDEKAGRDAVSLSSRDIHPSDMAPVLLADRDGLRCDWQRWGFPGFQGKKVIFNARSETAMEKPMFRESALHGRAVIPAAWFYEWSREREKNIFFRRDSPVLFMAGLYRQYREGARFVILTTEANETMRPIHDRMPLLLERAEVGDWLENCEKTSAFLRRTPALLERKAEYEQRSLF